MTLERLAPGMTDLLSELARFVPPAQIVDKDVYSPWLDAKLTIALQSLGAPALVISGGETDVCVLATVMGTVDRGYRVVIAADALCSSSDETHDALIKLYESRFSE